MHTKKNSEFLDHHLQPLLNKSEAYLKDTGDFLEKFKVAGEFPKKVILVTADVVGLYLSIPHDGGFEVPQKQYDKFKSKAFPTEDIMKMAHFVFKKNLFEFDCKLGLNLRRRMFAFSCLHFLKTQAIKPWLWKRFIDDILFYLGRF